MASAAIRSDERAVRETSSDDWLSQVRRGVLELAILTLIGRGEMYGYEIVSTLAEHAQLAAPEGTVYPILRRLKGDGMLSTRSAPSAAGPPRQYYALTERGRLRLRERSREWTKLIDALNLLSEKPS
jgi:PadR family transcriptional regulator PadR